jgi:hypothetical protein
MELWNNVGMKYVMDNMGIIAITVSMQYRNELMEREKLIM